MPIAKNYGVDGWGIIPEKEFKDSIAIYHNGYGIDDNFKYNISSIMEPPGILPCSYY